MVAHPVLAIEHAGRLIQADVAEGHGGAFVAEQLINAVVGAETAECAEAEQGRGVDRSGLLATHDAELQRLMGDGHTLVEDLPEAVLVSVGFQCDARNVHGDHAEVHAAVLDILAGLRVDPALQEGTAAHRSFEGAGDLHDVLVEDDVRVHALGGAFEGQLLQVVVRVARIGVHTVLDGEDELREDGGVMLGTKAADAVQEDGALDFAREPVGAETEADGHERGLAVGHTVGVDLVFHGLHGVVDGLAGLDLRPDLTQLLQTVGRLVERLVHRQCRTILFEVQALRLDGLGHAHLTFGDLDRQIVGHDLVGLLKELVVVLLGVFGEMLVGAVGGLATVLAGGHVLHDLGDLRGGDGDAVRRTHRRVAEGEAVGEHIPVVRQRAVGLRGERRVIGVVEVDVALHVGVGHRVRQHGEGGCLGHRAGQQVTLGGVDVGVLVGVLAHQRLVAVHQAAHGLVDVRGLGALDVLVQTVVGVGAGHVVQMVLDEPMLHEVLDVLDLRRTVVTVLDFGLDLIGDVANQPFLLRTDFLVEVGESRFHRADDVDRIEIDHTPVALLDKHLDHFRRVLGFGRNAFQSLGFHVYFLSGPDPSGQVSCFVRMPVRTYRCTLYAKVGTKCSVTTPLEKLYILLLARFRHFLPCVTKVTISSRSVVLTQPHTPYYLHARSIRNTRTYVPFVRKMMES